MTVVEATSTNGKFRTFTSENAALATVLSEVLNELDTHSVPMNMVQFQLAYDENSNKFAFVAICRRS